MQLIELIFLVAAVLISFGLTGLIRTRALARGMLDHPNTRSSHVRPTPRGGGLSIVITTTVGVILLAVAGVVDLSFALAITAGGVAIAAVGFMDDKGSLSVSIRLAVHMGAATWAMYILGGLPEVQVGDRLVDLGVYGYVLGILATTWTLNLFNFMDGIDGIAASEAIFIAGGGAILGLTMGSTRSVSLVGLLLAAASFGFLLWNWPPAKIFMGDVGSGYLGYVITVVALGAARENPTALFSWLTLGGVFFVDATVTLFRRLSLRRPVYEAHRTHAYQWLSRRYRSHLRVTIGALLINALWLLPLAWSCMHLPSFAWWISLLALAPLGVLAFVSGAGRPE